MTPSTLRDDLRFSFRSLARAPFFSLVVVFTLALGVGSSSAVFTVVDRILFRPLPYGEPGRLVSWGITGPIDENEFLLSKNYVESYNRVPPFASTTSISDWVEGDLSDRGPVRVRCIPVEANLLAVLGLHVAAGRDFASADDRPGAPRVALLSYALWRSRYGADPAMLNRIVTLDDQPTRLVGVLPESFELPTLGRADVLLPQQLERHPDTRALHLVRAFGRLRPGTTLAQAREQLQPFFLDMLNHDVPPMLRKEVHLALRSVRDRQVSNVRLASWMLFASVLALLSISCANVANLLLARAASREREWAMRAALGASRARLASQVLVESLLLSLAAALVGVGFAQILVRLFTALSPEGLLPVERVHLDPRVLVFTLVVSALAAICFGLAPALERPRPETLTGWRAIGGRAFLRHVLVAAQIAVSLVLLAGASLFTRSLLKLQSQPIGLQPARTLAVSFELSHSTYRTPEKLTAFYSQLETKLAQIPAVSALALSDSVPPGGWTHSRPFSNLAVPGEPPLPSEGGMVLFRSVSPAYFSLLHIPLLQGRAFNQADRTPAQNSIVLSATLARRIFGGRNPLGREIMLGPAQPAHIVVGVAGDVKNIGLQNHPNPEYYLPRKLQPNMGLGSRCVALLQSSAPLSTLAPWIRSSVASLDPRLILTIETMQERVSEESGRPRFMILLIGLFAAFGVVLAAVGLYGIMAFQVSRQTREIGVRMAVGATPADIARLIFKSAAVWTAAGAIVGIVASSALSRLARGLLFEISPYDPLSLGIALAVLAAAALTASLWPSQRAARVDPAISLRID